MTGTGIYWKVLLRFFNTLLKLVIRPLTTNRKFCGLSLSFSYYKGATTSAIIVAAASAKEKSFTCYFHFVMI